MTLPTTPASLLGPSKSTLEETKGQEHVEPTDHVEVSTRLTLDLATAGKENRRPHKLKKKKKKKLAVREEEPSSLKNSQPVDETPLQGFNQRHLDNMRMWNDLNNLTRELGAVRIELGALKREYTKQRGLLGVYCQMVQGPMDLKAALKKQNDELCGRMDELAETNWKLWKLRQQVTAGRPIGPPVMRLIERGTLAQPIRKKPPETKEELEEALAKAGHTTSQLSKQNLNLAKLVTKLRTELTKYRYLEDHHCDGNGSVGAFGELEVSSAIPTNTSYRPSRPSSIHSTIVAKDADHNKSDECKTRMAKHTSNTSINISTQVTNGNYDSKSCDENKPCNDNPNEEDESISGIKRYDENNKPWSEIMPNNENVCETNPNDDNKSNEKNNESDDLEAVNEDRDHSEPENWDLNNKNNDDHTSDEHKAVEEDREDSGPENNGVNSEDDNKDHSSQFPGANAKKRGWDDGKDNDEEDVASCKRVKTENIWKNQSTADFQLAMEGGGFLTSTEFVQLITNGASPCPSLSSN
ncbi:hypothetical protein BGZ93_005065 [Podila epicladia]|nr:hypothetical protein BGZ92_008515 [Podila epicladia]KAG0096067.1 hypothetical protein BGZ93_005065 [Podila epicladia]